MTSDDILKLKPKTVAQQASWSQVSLNGELIFFPESNSRCCYVGGLQKQWFEKAMNGNLETDNCFCRDSAYGHVWHYRLGWKGETLLWPVCFLCKNAVSWMGMKPRFWDSSVLPALAEVFFCFFPKQLLQQGDGVFNSCKETDFVPSWLSPCDVLVWKLSPTCLFLSPSCFVGNRFDRGVSSVATSYIIYR